MTAKVTDEEIEEFKARWAVEYAEWQAIQTELCTEGRAVTAFDVTAEQERRMRERGEVSVLSGDIAKKLGVSHGVMLHLADAPIVRAANVDQFLAGFSRAELREIRDACDVILGSGKCWRMGCREPVDEGKAECALHPFADEEDGPGPQPFTLPPLPPPAAGCFVPGCTGPCEGEPNRAERLGAAKGPVRCRISWDDHSNWRCHSAGCGDSGKFAGPHRLVGRSLLSIATDDLPGWGDAHVPGETCLFDRENSK